MIIYGEKILLRAIEKEDNQMLLDMINDPETEKMIGGMSFPVSLQSQMKWFENLNLENQQSIFRCIIAKKDDNMALGTLILNEIDLKNGTGHIHIKLAHNEVRGKGYGTDAINTFVKYAFNELRLNCLFANILSYNSISIRLFERCGFHREGILRSRIFKQGKYFDLISYSILSSDVIG